MSIKISELPEATSISDNDLLVVVSSGDPYVTKHITWNNLIESILQSIGGTTTTTTLQPIE